YSSRAFVPGRDDASPPFTTRETYLATGTILVLGTAAVYPLMRAGPEALAATSRVLIVAGLVGLFLMAVVVTLLSRTSRDSGGQGDRRDQPEPVPLRPMDDIDAELSRIIHEERTRRGSPC
ncbi:MAG: hypothetical protein ACRDYV_22275, partial [Acidimicrobiia bacterium]